MELKIYKQLEEARSHFYDWRMMDAYNILRRFFDRLPFRPEKEHAEYIGIFVRVLGELGKSGELKFYVSEMERLYQRDHNPIIGYSLAVAYLNLNEARGEACRRVAEELIQNPAAEAFHPKAKILLAAYYDRYRDDTAGCRAIIDSIGEVKDRSLGRLVDIWRAKVCRDEKRYVESEPILKKVIDEAEEAGDWYAQFSAETVLAIQFLKQKRLGEASGLLARIRRKFEGRHFKTVQVQLQELESQLKKASQMGALRIMSSDSESTFIYFDRPLVLKKRSASEKLLTLLARRKFLDKSTIVKTLLNREYDADRDDKIVYYHIHTLRKHLRSIGLPNEAIVNEGAGYRWIPEVETMGDEACA